MLTARTCPEGYASRPSARWTTGVGLGCPAHRDSTSHATIEEANNACSTDPSCFAVVEQTATFLDDNPFATCLTPPVRWTHSQFAIFANAGTMFQSERMSVAIYLLRHTQLDSVTNIHLAHLGNVVSNMATQNDAETGQIWTRGSDLGNCVAQGGCASRASLLLDQLESYCNGAGSGAVTCTGNDVVPLVGAASAANDADASPAFDSNPATCARNECQPCRPIAFDAGACGVQCSTAGLVRRCGLRLASTPMLGCRATC